VTIPARLALSPEDRIMGSARFRCAVYATSQVSMSAGWSRGHGSNTSAVSIPPCVSRLLPWLRRGRGRARVRSRWPATGMHVMRSIVCDRCASYQIDSPALPLPNPPLPVCAFAQTCTAPLSQTAAQRPTRLQTPALMQATEQAHPPCAGWSAPPTCQAFLVYNTKQTRRIATRRWLRINKLF
jgi:hypothetical protein